MPPGLSVSLLSIKCIDQVGIQGFHGRIGFFICDWFFCPNNDGETKEESNENGFSAENHDNLDVACCSVIMIKESA